MAKDGITMHFNPAQIKEFDGYLNKLLKNIGNTRPVMVYAVGVMSKRVQVNLREQPPSWPELKESTIEAREREKTWPGSILIAFGGLQRSLLPNGPNSFTKVTNKTAEFGTIMEQAPALHFGYPPRNLPARPFMFFKDEDINLIMSVAATFAFNPEKARAFGAAPAVGSIPESLFTGVG